MAELLNDDAIRHLAKDMADILPILATNQVTELILNPSCNEHGQYIGYILVDEVDKGLHNLLQTTTHSVTSPEINIGDQIVYRYTVNNPANTIMWVKINDSHIDFINQIRFCIISYLSDDVINQTENIQLLSYANQLLINYNYDLKSIALEQLFAEINPQLATITQSKLAYCVISHRDQIKQFNNYPPKLLEHKVVTMSATKAETIMSVLASISGKFIHHKQPYLECQIPFYGYRFTGLIPPVVPFPAFCIRKHCTKVFSLDDFVAQGVLNKSSRETIHNWVKRRFNILIAGGTGSGKTTLANAILYEISLLFPDTRIVIIEDVPELKFNSKRSIALTIGEFFSLHDALRTTLRFKPDRIVMGEIRGAEAYTILKAWNTGHPGGIATIHANGVNEALYRFENCILEYKGIAINRREIGFTINGIISIQNIMIKKQQGQEYVNLVKRKVTALRQILEYDTTKDIYQDIIYNDSEEYY
jgi:P-type conjugative transfer ATPase TrbB